MDCTHLVRFSSCFLLIPEVDTVLTDFRFYWMLIGRKLAKKKLLLQGSSVKSALLSRPRQPRNPPENNLSMRFRGMRPPETDSLVHSTSDM